MKSGRRLVVATAIIAIFASGVVNGSVTVPGSFDVSSSGAATYTVPISVPPGTAGVAPKLAFSYNSQGPVGQLGKGWTMAGLSTITRCGRTTAQDGGFPESVAFNSNDRFCLDGQRLVAVGGVYGTSGAEYRTERETFAKIISYGSAGSGPAYFKVWTKSGQVLEYGNSVDSRIESQGRSEARTWALNRIQDSKSNYLTISYTEDSTNGDYYPSRIDYTGNSAAGTPPNAAVVFGYEPRTDVAPYYQAGSVVRSLVRMAKVQTFLNSALVSEYRIGYKADEAQLRSRISSITLCDNANNCLPSNVFTWQDSGNTSFNLGTEHQSSGLSGSGVGQQEPDVLVALDINGDGKTDFIQKNLTEGTVLPILSTGNGFVNGPPVNLGTNFYNVRVLDINGDGKSDLVTIGGTSNGFRFTPWISNGATFTQGAAIEVANPFYFQDIGQTFILDIDGDGRQDVVQMYHQRKLLTTDPIGRVWLLPLLSTGTGLSAGNWYIASEAPQDGPYEEVTLLTGETNGDGKGDFIELWRRNDLWNPGNLWVRSLVSDGSKLNASAWQETSFRWNHVDSGAPWVTQMLPLDANGDGLTDFALTQNVYVHGAPDQAMLTAFYSTGANFVASPTIRLDQNVSLPPECAGAESDTYGSLATDLNSDGRTDVVQVWRCGTQGDTYPYIGSLYLQPIFSTGTSFSPASPISTGQRFYSVWRTGTDSEGLNYKYGDGPGLIFGDWNGDGKVDIVQPSFYDMDLPSLKFTPLFAGGQIGDLITKISNGIGAEIQLTHKPLTDPTVYTRDSDGTYPIQEIQSPIYAVSVAETSDGIGGTQLVNFQYGGMKRDLLRRMNLGTRWSSRTEVASGLSARAEHAQVWPLTGMEILAERKLGDLVLSRNVKTVGCTDFVSTSGCNQAVGRRYFTFVNQIFESASDLNGAPLPTITTVTQYDSWNPATNSWGNLSTIFGNPTRVKVTASDGYIRQTDYEYFNDTTNWLIGKPTKITQTNTTP